MEPSRNPTSANDWLRDFCLALKNVSLYSADHPRGAEYLDRSIESLRRAMGDRREAVLSRAGGRLYLDQILLDRDPGLAQQLAEDLEARGVESLVFHATMTPEEHLGLVRCLLAKTDRVAEKGGFRQLLIDEGVSSIKANEERAARVSGSGDEPSVTRDLSRDPAALARGVLDDARNREGGGVTTAEGLAEVLADALERLADQAFEEHRCDRHEILSHIGRAILGADPAIHAPLFLEKADPRSIRKNLVAAVEGLSPDIIADLVAIHEPLAGGDYRVLAEILNRTLAWRSDRATTVAIIERRLEAHGLSRAATRDLLDHLQWIEVPLSRRVELLSQGEALWSVDFSRVRDVISRLLANDQASEATGIIQRYLDGLASEDLSVRRRAADNARYVLQTIEKAGKAQPVLNRISELFLRRLQEEPDDDVTSRLAGGLAFLVDLWLRGGDLRPALDVMRKAEQLTSATSDTLRRKGERLTEALSRAGNDKTFGSLTGMLLEGGEHASIEAAEILKRGGGRSADYLIERLAEEENRSHRARLVTLLKEMGKGSSKPFLSRLEDPRWFLVRNVVGILGDIGDPSAMPALARVATHGDPRVRRELIRTLTRLETDDSREMIVAALNDEDRGVQITAVGALASVKGRRAREVLLDLAKKTGVFADAPVELRQEAFRGLAKARVPEAFDVLSAVIKRKGFLGFGESSETRAAAVKALGGVGSRDAIALLREVADKDPRQAVREAARETLEKTSKAEVNKAG